MPWSPSSGLANTAARLTAAAVLAPPGELRDIAPPVEMPDDPVWHLYLAAVVCIALIAAAVTFYVRRRRPEPVAPPVPPQETALEALLQLESAALDPRAFYTRLIEILRAYIAVRFGVDEPDDTASELLSALSKAAEVSEAHLLLLRGIVTESDLVKFAARLPAQDAPARALRACRDFVRETAVVEAEEAAHAL